MDAVKIIRDANWRLEVGDITREQYQELIAPLRDVEVVVRCKDCLHNCACEIQYHAQAGDLFFCGAAERKDGDHRD